MRIKELARPWALEDTLKHHLKTTFKVVACDLSNLPVLLWLAVSIAQIVPDDHGVVARDGDVAAAVRNRGLDDPRISLRQTCNFAYGVIKTH